MSLLTGTTAEAMLRATGGVAVVFGGESTYGQVDTFDEALLDGTQVVGKRRGVTVATGTISAGEGDTLSVGGTNYTVREAPMQLDDGGLTLFLLADA